MTHHNHPDRNKHHITVLAPARTCLFGDHQDYLYLPVIACAINRHITLEARAENQRTFQIDLPDMGENKTIALDEDFSKGVKGDHLLSGFKVFKDLGGSISSGYHITIKGNVAINAGISSSSAVMVAWITFLLKAGDHPRSNDREFIAQLAYTAEVTEQDSPGGRMDQYSIALGNIMFLETGENGRYQLFEKQIPGLIVGESGIPKPTLSLLGDLRSKAWKAIEEIRQKLPDFRISEIQPEALTEYLPLVSNPLRPVFEAAVRNHAITMEALKEIENDPMDMTRIGELMNQHHEILDKLLGITVPLIDRMTDAALSAGALGTKIVGSGLGGSIIALAREEDVQKVIAAIKDAGARDAYAVQTDPGVRVKNTSDE
ncbi:mevalonate kinase family protein [Robertkochia flava]|uniref:mevalonate kinase family protein n=1 Tax=Robertkochia flava TaxID=3447986 RepID=UPI001CC9C430|nr:galactokinase family protein [Robertkochia marina]